MQSKFEFWSYFTNFFPAATDETLHFCIPFLSDTIKMERMYGQEAEDFMKNLISTLSNRKLYPLIAAEMERSENRYLTVINCPIMPEEIHPFPNRS